MYFKAEMGLYFVKDIVLWRIGHKSDFIIIIFIISIFYTDQNLITTIEIKFIFADFSLVNYSFVEGNAIFETCFKITIFWCHSKNNEKVLKCEQSKNTARCCTHKSDHPYFEDKNIQRK